MRTKLTLAVTACALLAAGCGSSSKHQSKTTAMSKDPVTRAKQEQVSRLQADLNKHPNDPVRMENLANAYVALASPSSGDLKMPAGSDGNYKQALTLLQKAYAISPNDPSVAQNLVDSLMHAHQYPDAEKLLKTLVTQKGVNANTYYQLALASQSANDFSTAIGAWNNFIANATKGDPRIKEVKSFIAGDKAAQKEQSAAKSSTTKK